LKQFAPGVSKRLEAAATGQLPLGAFLLERLVLEFLDQLRGELAAGGLVERLEDLATANRVATSVTDRRRRRESPGARKGEGADRPR
jgi:hypothetical protein